MFTLKHVTLNGETLYAGDEVTSLNYPNSPDIEIVHYTADGVVKGLRDGIVYVMNPEGATVGKYDMRALSDAMTAPQAYAPGIVGAFGNRAA